MYTTGTPSELMETNDYVYTSTQWGDLLTAYNGNMIYYDGSTTLGSFTVGNPTTYHNGTAWTFTWEHGRQLATMQTGSTTWTNTYNSAGLRTKRTDGTTTYTYYYEEGRLSAIKRNDLNMWIIYDENGPVTIKYGVGTFHYVTNLQGDVVAIVGADGRKLVEYTYDAWGKVTSITGDYAYNLGIHNPILYRGYIYDHETGFYYVSSRYYDPEIGRFINADDYVSTGQGIIGCNMFTYCNNNSVNMIDPTGTMPKFLPEFLEEFSEWVETALGTLLYVTEVNKKGFLKEYWVDSNGKVRWSRHHTNHGNSKKHPVVPHDHEWYDDDDGNNTEDPKWQPPNPGFQAPGSDNDNSTKIVAGVAGTVAVVYVIYVGAKWIIAALAAPATGGGSLIVAGVTP